MTEGKRKSLQESARRERKWLREIARERERV